MDTTAAQNFFAMLNVCTLEMWPSRSLVTVFGHSEIVSSCIPIMECNLKSKETPHIEMRDIVQTGNGKAKIAIQTLIGMVD